MLLTTQRTQTNTHAHTRARAFVLLATLFAFVGSTDWTFVRFGEGTSTIDELELSPSVAGTVVALPGPHNSGNSKGDGCR